jgi:hypothetical protein
LRVGDLLQRLGVQVIACLLHVLRHATPKVVCHTQIKMVFSQIPNLERIAHLKVESIVIIHLLIAPTERRLDLV